MKAEEVENKLRHGASLEQLATERQSDPLDLDAEICYDFLLISTQYLRPETRIS